MTVTYAHVEDIAEATCWPWRRVSRERSITWPVLPSRMGEAVKLWSQVSGRRAPFFSIPARVVKPLAPLAVGLGKLLSLPDVISRDTFAILDATYLGRSDKAIRELGWTRRPLELVFVETFKPWLVSPRPPPAPRDQSTGAKWLRWRWARGSVGWSPGYG